jgi:magnesium transporter
MAMPRLIKRGLGQGRNLPPGTPVFIGPERTGRAGVRVMDYNADRFEERRLGAAQECGRYLTTDTVTWINVDGIHDVATVQTVAQQFRLHPLVIESIVNTGQRPKVELHGTVVYMVVKMLMWDEAAGELDSEQVSLVLGGNFVLSFQEKEGDVFEPVRERVRNATGRVRTAGADYLFYTLLDCLVDGYFSIMENSEEAIDHLEEQITDDPKPVILRELRQTRRRLIFLRKSVWPLREAVSVLCRGDSDLIREDSLPYLRDVYDHAVQVMDTIESFRDVVSGMQDTYLGNVSNRMNEVMKMLTIIATIFIPLTFIAGIYGMNFRPEASPWNMPELEWYWGYPAVLLVMALVVGAMLVYFRRKRWL